MAAVQPVSMHQLLASCEAAKAVSRPPRAPEARPEGARGRADHATAAACARPAATNPRTPDGAPRHDA
ncbi:MULTISPECIES: hypothetical protein [Streptomyces]|uniref:Uncharacterized protein n=1 Tax=Streptomyces flaveolus TaxID=67297 RepID=A0ABV3A4R7_9ACTN|nr:MULTISPECIES: hypothetical protein [Streptomyces]KMS93120.1 hypothetical protein ACZ91_00995 [Streptomyces regensis]KOG59804.1 hypothetical protein ADK77_38735 [Streptomyces antibioticus]KOV92443.1 hypothetical protein ADL02_11415 [Streptomyces sp. NRRL WC-3723]MBG7700677.1 hypothetical protein [Streptomyces sp. MC1]